MTHNKDTDDDFWKVALYDTERMRNDDDDENGKEEPSLNCVVVDSNSLSYRNNNTYAINIPPYGLIDLHLIPLPSSLDGEFFSSPVGSDAWYGSALLSAMFHHYPTINAPTSCRHMGSTTDIGCNAIQPYLNHCFQQHRIYNTTATINILELGSGAVGLAGIIAGLSVRGYYMQQQQNNADRNDHSTHYDSSTTKCRVILTDREPNVLQQLEYNVSTMVRQLQCQFSPSILPVPEFIVRHLDWDNNMYDLHSIYAECSISHNNVDEKRNSNYLQLVIGSELIYNHETAKACVKIVLQLLHDNPQVLIIIVNNASRDGWDTIFLSTLYKIATSNDTDIGSNNSNVRYKLDSSILYRDVYDIAYTLIQPGGTLNPLSDFAICYVWNDTT